MRNFLSMPNSEVLHHI